MCCTLCRFYFVLSVSVFYFRPHNINFGSLGTQVSAICMSPYLTLHYAFVVCTPFSFKQKKKKPGDLVVFKRLVGPETGKNFAWPRECLQVQFAKLLIFFLKAFSKFLQGGQSRGEHNIQRLQAIDTIREPGVVSASWWYWYLALSWDSRHSGW